MSRTLQLRRGTAAEWALANPVLAPGEPGLETDTGIFKLGDGATAWDTLPQAGGAALLVPFGVSDAVVPVVGKHHFPITQDTVITRIEATLDANGPADLTVTLQDESAPGTVVQAVTGAGETLIAAGETQGSIAVITNPDVPLGHLLRMDIVAADAAAADLVITVYGQRS